MSVANSLTDMKNNKATKRISSDSSKQRDAMSSLMTMTLASLRFLATNGSFIIHRRAPWHVLGYSRTIGEANLLQLSSSKIDGWMCVGAGSQRGAA